MSSQQQPPLLNPPRFIKPSQASTMNNKIDNSKDKDLLTILSEPSFQQIPLLTSIHQVDNGSAVLAELCRIFQGRVEVEDRDLNFSIKVSRPNIYESEIKTSSSERALGFLKNYYLFMSREQASARRAIDENIAFDLLNYKTERATESTNQKNIVSAVTTEVLKAEEALEKVKKSYLKTVEELQQTKEKLVAVENVIAENAKMSEEKRKEKEKESKRMIGMFFKAFELTPEQEKDSYIKKIKRLEEEVIMKNAEIDSKKSTLLEKMAIKDDMCKKAMASFTATEKIRLQKLEKSLKHFVKIERQVCEARLKLLKDFEDGAIVNLNGEDDLNLFIKNEKNIEETHFYSKALEIFDYDYRRRRVGKENNNSNKVEKGKEATAQESKGDKDGEGEKDGKVSVSTGASSGEELREASGSIDDEMIVEEDGEDIKSDDVDNSLPISGKPEDTSLQSPLESTPDKSSGRRFLGKAKMSKVTITSKINEIVDYIFINKPLSSQSNGSKNERSISVSGTLTPSFVNSTPTTSSRSASVSATKSVLRSPKIPLYNSDLEILCSLVFMSRYGRDLFLQILDERRGRMSELSPDGFNSMTATMKVFLDCSMQEKHFFSALRIANMSNTFHTTASLAELTANDILLGSIAESPAVLTSDEASTSPKKRYVQQEDVIRDHKIWRMPGFWEQALLEGVNGQLDLLEPFLWDEIEPEMLKERVIGLHNIIFGQLGTMAFTMHEIGLKRKEVERLIYSMAEGAQIGEDLIIDLLKSVKSAFKNEVDDTIVTEERGSIGRVSESGIVLPIVATPQRVEKVDKVEDAISTDQEHEHGGGDDSITKDKEDGTIPEENLTVSIAKHKTAGDREDLKDLL